MFSISQTFRLRNLETTAYQLFYHPVNDYFSYSPNYQIPQSKTIVVSNPYQHSQHPKPFHYEQKYTFVSHVTTLALVNGIIIRQVLTLTVCYKTIAMIVICVIREIERYKERFSQIGQFNSGRNLQLANLLVTYLVMHRTLCQLIR